MTTARRDFDQQIIAGALLVRLLALMLALLGMVGQTITFSVLLCIVVMAGSSLSFLLSPSVAGFAVRHPLAIVGDVLLTLAVLAVVGVGSPLVLTTLSTALVIGVLFTRPVVVPALVVLVAGYLTLALSQPATAGFMERLGIPCVYVCLAAVGAVVRAAHLREIRTNTELIALHRAVAGADERGRLARDMHDSLGKTLHGIALAAEALPLWVERDPPTAVRYANGLADAANQAAAEARSLLVRLRSDQTDRPLVDVLAEQCARWEDESGTPCRFSAVGVVDVEAGAHAELVAIVGEALHNVRRHARAGQVDVLLSTDADGLVRIDVLDDGRGFVPRPDGTGPEGHYGLRGMQERAAQIGAELDVTSTPGRGTRVTVLTNPVKEPSGAV